MTSSTSTPTSLTSSLTASRCRSDWLKAFGKTLDVLRETGFDEAAVIVKKFIMQEDQIMDDVSIPIAGAANADASSAAGQASKNEKKNKAEETKTEETKTAEKQKPVMYNTFMILPFLTGSLDCVEFIIPVNTRCL